MVRSNLVSISVGYPNLFNVKLTNTQNVDTPSPFQQMLQLPVSQLQSYTPILASDLHNIRFVYNGTGIPAWLESISNGTATIWVKLPVSIPANSSITIDMEVDPSLNFDGNYWGEAPQLSPTYAQYDDGANVFPFYVNFAGTSAPSNITTLGTATSFNNGATLSAGDFFETNSKVYNTQTQILDAYISSITYGTSGDNAGISFVVDPSGNQYTLTPHYVAIGTGGGQFYSGILNQFSTSSDFGTVSVNSGNYTGSGSLTTSTGIWSLWATSSASYGSINYGSPLTVTSNIPPAGSYYIMAGASSGASTVTYQWVRVRAYPPNGVMPSVEVIA